MSRSTIKIAALALSTALVAGPAMAQEFSITAGATLTSRYLANGIPQSDGPAFQPYIEAELEGFYAGLWASNVSRKLTGARGEVNVGIGYRNEVGMLSYDIGYTRFLYTGPSSNCCGEAHFALGVSPSDAFTVEGRIAYDPQAKVSNLSLSAMLSVTDDISVMGTVGRVSRGGPRYAELGLSYAFNDNMSVTLSGHRATSERFKAVLSFDYSFNLR
jgi:uncharacterized protein (TIGR02001 family)